MAVMNWTNNEGVAIITMTNGENRHNLVFSQSLNAILDEIAADQTVNALILTSNDEKNFSQGIDVEWIMARFQKNDFGALTEFS